MSLLERNSPSVHTAGLPEPWRSAMLTIVLPTYNEAANLPVVVAALFSLPLTALRILVVDDNSPDGTGDIAEEVAARHGKDRIYVVHRPRKEGLGRAYVDGMTRAIRAGAEFVVQMDSDLSHRPEEVPQMLAWPCDHRRRRLRPVCVTKSLASVAGDSPSHTRLLSAFANTYVRVLLQLGIRDVTAFFKLWRSASLEEIDVSSIRSDGYSFQVEMNYRAIKRGLKILELPIDFADRSEGESKMSLREPLESVLMPFLLRYRKA